jgi:hypothetical protein
MAAIQIHDAVSIDAIWQSRKEEEKTHIVAHFQDTFFMHNPPHPITEKIRTVLDKFKQGPDPSWLGSFYATAAKMTGASPRTELFNEIDCIYQRATKTLSGITSEALTISDSSVDMKKNVICQSKGAYYLRTHSSNREVGQIRKQLSALTLLPVPYPFSTLCDYKRVIDKAQSQLFCLQLTVEEALEKVHANIQESDQTRDEKLVTIISEHGARINSIMETTRQTLLEAVSIAVI